MQLKDIVTTVNRLKRKYRTRDPVKLCEQLGVRLEYIPMGKRDLDCKGFFVVIDRIRCIVINRDLDADTMRIVLFHELGHAVLHWRLAGRGVQPFSDFALFDATTATEYEANIFAAEYLMDTDDVLDALNEDQSFFSAAASLGVPAELLDFKFRIMKRQNYAVQPPLEANSAFLKKMAVQRGHNEEI